MYPLISIIIPTYNRGNIVEKAIKSAITQNYRPLEIIVIDDGSNDNTKEIVKNIQEEHKELYDGLKIDYIYQHNQGVSAARNNGISHSKGEYICFLDSDDIYYPLKVLEQYKLLNNSKADCCYSCAIYKGIGYQYIKRNKALGKYAVLSFLNGDILTSLNTWLFRANLIKKHNINFRLGCNWGEDNEFLVKCLYYSHKVVYTNQILVEIKLGRLDGLSKFSWSHIEKDIKINNAILEFLMAQNIPFEEKQLYRLEVEERLLPKLTMNSIWSGYKSENESIAYKMFNNYRQILKKYKSSYDVYSIKYWIKYFFLSLRIRNYK